MKKLDYVFIMLLLGAFTMVGCTKQGSISEPAEKTAEIEFSISKADLAMKSGALDDNNWYCPEELPPSGQATVTYSVNVYNNSEDFTDEGVKPSATYSDNQKIVSYSQVNDNALTDQGEIQSKIQLNWNSFNCSADQYLTVTVEAVNIGIGTNGYSFAAPNPGSPLYESYIPSGKGIGTEQKIDLYEKVYMDIKVLCFNEQDIPDFGFSWFDFEIITGEEVCVYFNCLEEDIDVEGNRIHKNVTTDYSASFYTVDSDGNVEWTKYWEDGIDKLIYGINCIQLPANYETYGIKVAAGNETVDVTPKDIAAFLSRDFSYERVVDGSYEVSLDTDDNSAYFLHFVLDDCDYNASQPD